MNRIVYVFIAVAMLAFAGCKSRKVNLSNAGKVRLEKIERFKATVNIKIKDNGTQMTIPAHVQFVRDSVLGISIMPLGIEMGYARIMKNEVIIVNKMRHQYVDVTMDELKSIDDNSLQQLLSTCNDLNPTLIVDALLGRAPEPMFTVSKQYPPKEAFATMDGNTVRFKYDKWIETDANTIVPSMITVEVTGEDSSAVTLEINKITLREAGALKEINTSKFEKVSINNIF